VKDLVNNDKGETDYDKVSELADRVLEGTARITRLNREEEAGRIAGGRRNVEASIVCGAHKRDSAVGESSSYEDIRGHLPNKCFSRRENISIEKRIRPKPKPHRGFTSFN
jgi:hypothetical protein